MKEHSYGKKNWGKHSALWRGRKRRLNRVIIAYFNCTYSVLKKRKYGKMLMFDYMPSGRTNVCFIIPCTFAMERFYNTCTIKPSGWCLTNSIKQMLFLLAMMELKSHGSTARQGSVPTCLPSDIIKEEGAVWQLDTRSRGSYQFMNCVSGKQCQDDESRYLREGTIFYSWPLELTENHYPERKKNIFSSSKF